MPEEIILTSISLSRLEEIITNSIKRVVGSSAIEDVQEQEMNQKSAAAFLNISEQTLIAWRKKGMVPYEKLDGSSKIKFYKSQLRKVLAKNPGLLQAARK